MLGSNIPVVKLGIIAVSRDCFPIGLSTQRRKNIVAGYGDDLYECPITVENEKDMLAAVADVQKAECNALVVFLGNFGPETPETLIAEKFDGPCMFVAAAEGDGQEYARRVRREQLSTDHMRLLNWRPEDGDRDALARRWIADCRAFGVCAAAETTDPGQFEAYASELL